MNVLLKADGRPQRYPEVLMDVNKKTDGGLLIRGLFQKIRGNVS